MLGTRFLTFCIGREREGEREREREREKGREGERSPRKKRQTCCRRRVKIEMLANICILTFQVKSVKEG